MESDVVRFNQNFTYDQILEIYETFTLFQNKQTEKLKLSYLIDSLKLNNFENINPLMFKIFTELEAKYQEEIDFPTFLSQLSLKIVQFNKIKILLSIRVTLLHLLEDRLYLIY